MTSPGLPRRLGAGAVRLIFSGYRLLVSPVLHTLGAGGCRFQPTCSEYAEIAMARFGPVRGGWMALRRFARCQPLCRGGFDPVPKL